MDINHFILDLREQGLAIYERSVTCSDDSCFAIVRNSEGKHLAVSGPEAEAFEGESITDSVKLCLLSADNARELMRLFSWTKPRSRGDKTFTFGMGDRLGLATPGHLRAIKDYDVFPILAQQSIRELNLTNRSFPEVIGAASFSVFQEGYRDGFGADGDHLKTIDEINYALDSGCTMITLDCSEHINTTASTLSASELQAAYAKIPEPVRHHYEDSYANKDLPIIGRIDAEELQRIVLTFYKAIDHTKVCYAHMIGLNDQVDFEMSIDETPGNTSPAEHYVVGSELAAADIDVSSMAPHFCGQFEKGIDYIGDLEQLEIELQAHQAIAEHFAYRLSLHSGSDKFAVFPLFGQITNLHAHMKIAGTNWLEATRVLARSNPSLFRRMLEFSISQRSEAERYYHISTRLEDIMPLESRSDEELPLYLEEDAARQTIHITYGLLLNEVWFRDAFFAFMDEHEEDYAEALDFHIGKHLSALSSSLG